MSTRTSYMGLWVYADGEYGWQAGHRANWPIIEAEALRVSGIIQPDGSVVAPGNVTIGGVTRNSWPASVAGSNGQVVMTGTVPMNGRAGTTVTHNIGHTNYTVKVSPNGINAGDLVGAINVIKAANTAVITNSGIGSADYAQFTADIEISLR